MISAENRVVAMMPMQEKNFLLRNSISMVGRWKTMHGQQRMDGRGELASRETEDTVRARKMDLLKAMVIIHLPFYAV